MFSSPKMHGGSDLVKIEFSTESNATNAVPPTDIVIGGCLACLNFGSIGNVVFHHPGLKPNTNIG